MILNNIEPRCDFQDKYTTKMLNIKKEQTKLNICNKQSYDQKVITINFNFEKKFIFLYVTIIVYAPKIWQAHITSR